MSNANRPKVSRNRIAIILADDIPAHGWLRGQEVLIAPGWLPPAPAWIAWKRHGEPFITLAPRDLPPGLGWYAYGGLRSPT